MGLRVRFLPDDNSEDTRVFINGNYEGDPPDRINADLWVHDALETWFTTTISCHREVNGTEWRGSFGLNSSRPRLLELTSPVMYRGGHEVQLRLQDCLQYEDPETLLWAGGWVAKHKRSVLLISRENYYARELTSPAATESAQTHSYSAVLVADNLLLGSPTGVPGIRVIPLDTSTLGGDLGQVLVDVLARLKYNHQLDGDLWMKQMQDARPAAVIHISNINAVSVEDAENHALNLTRRLLDVLAITRIGKPNLLGGVIVPSGKDAAEEVSHWYGYRYNGNLFSGSIAGGGPGELAAIWNAVETANRSLLWISQYADAVSDPRPDYRFFRLFNLLEGVATEVVPAGVVVLDQNGKPYAQSNGEGFTTNEARGKILELLRQAVRVSEFDNIGGRENDVWSVLGLFVGIRNEIAHRGTWRRPAEVKPTPDRRRLERKLVAFYGEQEEGEEFGYILFELSSLARSVMRWAMTEGL